MHPSVSACLIVRDEEANLERCLSSLVGAVDQIVVVDTGSLDGTIALARRLGADVFTEAWSDDFSAARNASLRHASGDWCIWVDADEALLEGQPGALRALCAAGVGPGYLLGQHNLATVDGLVASVTWQCRIFPNRTGARFEGRVHEQLAIPGYAPEDWTRQDRVWIQHYGYLDGAVLDQKSVRNRRLLRQAIDEQPGEPFHRYNLGRLLVTDGEVAAGLQELTEAIQQWSAVGRPRLPYLDVLFTAAVSAAVKLGRYAEALGHDALSPVDARTAEQHYYAGLALWGVERPRDAVPRLKAAQRPTEREGYQQSWTLESWAPALTLAKVYLALKEPRLARAAGGQARRTAPRNPEVLFLQALAAHQCGDGAEATIHAREALECDPAGTWAPQARRLLFDIAREAADDALVLEALAGEVAGIGEGDAMAMRAEVFGRRGELQQQYDALDRAVKAYPANFTPRLSLADFLAAQSMEAEALHVLAAGLDQADPPTAFYERLATLLDRAGRPADAGNARLMAARIKTLGR